MAPTGAADIGSLVFLEHVNLRVPDHGPATAFFIEGLGLTRDPYRMVGTRNMWVNVGLQQFHLPLGDPAPWPGEIGLVVPDLEEAERSLRRVAPTLHGSAFRMEREDGTLLAVSPWGHRIRVLPRGAGRLPQALAYVEFWVPPGTARGIGVFYEQVLDSPVAPRGGDLVEVTAGPGQVLRFQERPDAGVVPNTSHVAVYLARYRRIYADLERRGLLMQPDRDEQFRFCDIVDPGTGRRLYRFEHEVRSLHHPSYRRPLVNRVPVPWPVD
jgi:hypothetical protein